MNILAIDNTTEQFSMAVKSGDNIFHEVIEGREAAENFTSLLDLLLGSAKISLDDIDLFVIGTGPGSFTGLRMSLSVIKAFHAALDKPCIGIPSYTAIVRQYSVENKPCAVIFDAKKDMVYGAVYKREGDRLHVMIKEELCSLKDFLINRCGTDYVFTGQSIDFIDRIHDIYPFADVLANVTHPEARFLIEEAVERYERGSKHAPEGIELLYMHPDTCNVRI